MQYMHESVFRAARLVTPTRDVFVGGFLAPEN